MKQAPLDLFSHRNYVLGSARRTLPFFLSLCLLRRLLFPSSSLPFPHACFQREDCTYCLHRTYLESEVQEHPERFQGAQTGRQQSRGLEGEEVVHAGIGYAAAWV